MNRFLFFFVLTFQGIFAQSNIVASGGNASGPDGSVSYSIGQVAQSSFGDSNIFIIEGVQQPFEAMPLSVPEIPRPKIKLYPNPAVNIVNLEIETFAGDIHYSLSDITGKIIIRPKPVNSEITLLSMTELPGGIYILKVTSGNDTIKSFKILKK